MSIKKPRRGLHRWASVALGVALSAGGVAHADIGVVPHGVDVVPGQPAQVSFDLDFGSGLAVSSFTANLDFDATKLGFNPLTNLVLTVPGVPAADIQAAVSSGSLGSNADAQGFSATWIADFASSHWLNLSGKGTLTATFATGALAVGDISPVTFRFEYSNFDAGIQDLVDHAQVQYTANITAVPEPASVHLLLAGLGLAAYAALQRRRHHA